MDNRQCHEVMTATDLRGDVLQNCTRARMGLVLEIDHGSLMIMVPDSADEADHGSGSGVGDEPLKVSDADRLVNDPGEHDDAREHAVDHIHILPHCPERREVG